MKRLDATNWLETDPHAGMPQMDLLAWRDAFLAIRLDARVPAEVAAQFEAARGSVIYGGFFSPLVALGVAHCYRVLEAGVRARCARLGLPVAFRDQQGREHPLSFDHNLRQLVERGLVAGEAVTLWKQAAELRHWAALPDSQPAVGPEHAVTALTRAAALLNALYA